MYDYSVYLQEKLTKEKEICKFQFGMSTGRASEIVAMKEEMETLKLSSHIIR